MYCSFSLDYFLIPWVCINEKYIRMYVCMHVCMYACMYVCMYVCTCYVLIKPPMPIHYVLAAVFASCFYVLKSLLQEWGHIYLLRPLRCVCFVFLRPIRMWYVCMYTYVCICMYMHVCVCVSVRRSPAMYLDQGLAEREVYVYMYM